MLFKAVPHGALNDIPPPPREGMMIVGLPCMPDELPKRWQQLREHADTARRLGLSYIVQQPCRESLLKALEEHISLRQLEKLHALAPTLDMALRNGALTLKGLAATAQAAVETLAIEVGPFMVASGMEKELRMVFRQRLAQCDTAVQLCDAVALVLQGRSGREDGCAAFEHGVRVYIEAHYADECSLNGISQAFRYSTSHFSRLFSAAFGATFTRYLADYRLEKAREFLKTTDLPINLIAQRVGIGDPGYFIRQFRKKYHMSPSKYRKFGS